MIYCCNRIGQHHTVSEDAILVGDKVFSDGLHCIDIPENGSIAVADGVGGNYGGADASNFVLGQLSAFRGDDVAVEIVNINHDLLTRGKDTAQADMATTLTGLYLQGKKRMLFHVGNTRAYALQGHYLKQLTTDHTVYQWLKSSGQIAEAEACNKNEITACLGGGDESLLKRLTLQEITSYRYMLFTSDGIHEYVDIDDLEAIVNKDIPEEDKCKHITELAVANGSEDDLSVVIAVFS